MFKSILKGMGWGALVGLTPLTGPLYFLAIVVGAFAIGVKDVRDEAKGAQR